MGYRDQIPARTCSSTGEANELLPRKQNLHKTHDPSMIQTSHARIS